MPAAQPLAGTTVNPFLFMQVAKRTGKDHPFDLRAEKSRVRMCSTTPGRVFLRPWEHGRGGAWIGLQLVRDGAGPSGQVRVRGKNFGKPDEETSLSSALFLKFVRVYRPVQSLPRTQNQDSGQRAIGDVVCPEAVAGIFTRSGIGGC